MKIITVIARNENDALAKKFANLMFKNKQYVELLKPQPDIMDRFNIKSLPAVILDSGTVIYENEIREAIRKMEGNPSKYYD